MLTEPPFNDCVLVLSVGGGSGGYNSLTRGSRTGLIRFCGKSGSSGAGPECRCLNDVTQTSGRIWSIVEISDPGVDPVVVSEVHETLVPASKMRAASPCIAAQCSAAP